jgi:hypothetical protein
MLMTACDRYPQQSPARAADAAINVAIVSALVIRCGISARLRRSIFQ